MKASDKGAEITLLRFRVLKPISFAILCAGLLSAIGLLGQQSRGDAVHPQTSPKPLANSFSTAWQPVGPNSVSSLSYGLLSGRVLSLTLDPSDATGNTVYLGMAGGGVWKSMNAAGSAAAVTYTPLTDTLPVFGASSGANPSLFIGALAVQPVLNPVVLAGTGDPSNNVDSYYGEGILRSVDGGVTWTLVQLANDLPNAVESFVGLSAAGFAWSTASPSLVVAAFTTSPQSTAVQATQTTSVPGLYYSTDAGATWHMASVYDGASVVQQPQLLSAQSGNAATSVVWSPKRKQFIAALRAHGYYSSADGVTWKRLDSQPGANITTANCPVVPLGSGAACPVYRGALAVQQTTGDTYAWTVDVNGIDQGIWHDQCNLTSSGVCTNANAQFAARVDHGALDPSGGVVPGGSSALSLLAVPVSNSGTTLFAGATDLYRCSLASGAADCTFRNTTNALNGCATPAGVAPGQHALAAGMQSSGNIELLIGNEGGLWRSMDGVNESGAVCNATDAGHFDNLNAAIASAGSASEVVGLAQDPADPSILLAGLGSNGTAATSVALSSIAPWAQISAGEGGLSQVDQTSSSNWYAAIGSGINLKQCTSGKSCAAVDFAAPATIGSAQVSNDVSPLHAPSLLDPAQTSNAVLGTCRVWRGPAGMGSQWSDSNAISAPVAGSAPCTAASPLIRSIAAGGPAAQSTDAQHNGSTVMYAGMAGLVDGGGVLGGHLFMTKAANTASNKTRWTDVSSGIVTNDSYNGYTFNASGYSVSSVFVDSHDATGATVYATIMGFVGPHLYRSADFGAHWLNVSSNLPRVPANDVVVDPDDANTVYIALDSGVYATTDINSCSTSDCWALLGSGLPNAPVTQLRVGTQLPTGDGRLGMLRAATYGRGIWQIALLNAISIATPGLTAAPFSLQFAAQQVGTRSDPQTITFRSSGNAPVTITSVAMPNGFVEADSCVGKTLSVGDQCSAQVQFAPTNVGSSGGVLTIYANVAGGQVVVGLSGVGTSPASIVLTPNALAFPATVVNQNAAAQNITIANTGGNTATLQSPMITGDFSIVANTCGASLASQSSCTLSIQFTPTSSGTLTGLLTVADSAGTQTASLSGTGNRPATDTIGPPSLTFAQQAIGTISASQQVTITNAGDVALTINSVGASGDFTVNNNCGASLPGRSSCAIHIGFVPTSVGTETGTLTITDQFRSQTVTLNGIGVAPAGVSLSPTSLTFVGTAVGLSAPAQAVTLTNNGGLPLAITQQSVSGDFTIAASTCGATLAVNAACTMTIIFTPISAGVRSGSLLLTDNALSGTQKVTLTGTGIDFAFAASGPTSQTVSSGASATYAMSLSSASGLSGNITFGCTGAPAHSQCNVNPGTVSLGVSSTVIVTVQTALNTASLDPLQTPWRLSKTLAVLAMLFPICFLRKKRRTRALVVVTLTCALFGVFGCGTPRTIPGSGGTVAPPTPTPTGTYTLTVTASTAGISHSVPLTLIVQ